MLGHGIALVIGSNGSFVFSSSISYSSVGFLLINGNTEVALYTASAVSSLTTAFFGFKGLTFSPLAMFRFPQGSIAQTLVELLAWSFYYFHSGKLALCTDLLVYIL